MSGNNVQGSGGKKLALPFRGSGEYICHLIFHPYFRANSYGTAHLILLI